MNEALLRTQLVQTGKDLLSAGLVARTWGNVSARMDETHCLISPSGLDYHRTTEEDIVLLDLETGAAAGSRKPSGEKAVHIAAYRHFPEVQFVIHTHQKYASVIGLTGEEGFVMMSEEEKALGGAGFAEYGRPGTQKLSDAVDRVLAAGKQTVFMKHHGVLICARSREEAMERARLLENLCERLVRESGTADDGLRAGCTESISSDDDAAASGFGAAAVQSSVLSYGGSKILNIARRYLGSDHVDLFSTRSIRSCADSGRDIPACLDDMAQMIGRTIPVCAAPRQAITSLRQHNVVLLRGYGALIRAEDADDLAALKLLTDKAACAYLYCLERGERHTLPLLDVVRMRGVYLSQYAGKKNG